MPSAVDPLCASCGLSSTAATQISDLENQVRVLTEQSVDALNRLASYEDEIRQLRMQRTAAHTTPAPTPVDPQHSYNNSVDSAASNGYGLNRFASFRMGRKPSTGASNSSVDLGDLQSQLQKETQARVEAERKAAQLNGELEDLSQNLFEQANEMVATERRARSKLEERIKVLERRDQDKSKRLEKIEGAMKRLDRVKALLAGNGPPSPPT
ncbi:Rab guanine nucleotide exchange factor SEC2 [Sphaceloma murrayae]|uniref:Rab guanine nucleotide exchange factor SEC2 n=1 Tax=Sphaceloma murrayae TaxID=2082308 RepID=A0A2K1QW25_9PEZI|nr:Rab guanine nucleotide exchange factor SEC2 [Sphaceloma murrayae]